MWTWRTYLIDTSLIQLNTRWMNKIRKFDWSRMRILLPLLHVHVNRNLGRFLHAHRTSSVSWTWEILQLSMKKCSRLIAVIISIVLHEWLWFIWYVKMQYYPQWVWKLKNLQNANRVIDMQYIGWMYSCLYLQYDWCSAT